MALGSVVISLLLQTGSFETDTRKAERRLKEMEQTAKKVGAAVGTAAVAVGTATALMIRNAINSMDQLDKMARQIGVATEELTGLRYAAEQMAGVTAGQFDMALRRMTRRIEEAAAGGGPAADALDRMGLSARNLARLSPDEQFRKFAEAIRQTSTQGERLRNVMALMDTEGMPLVGMMQQGAEAIRGFEEEAARLGLTIDSETARAAGEFNRDLAALRSSVTGLGMQVTADLLPDLKRLSLQFKEVATEGDKVSVAARNVADSIRLLAEFARMAATGLTVLGSAALGVRSDMLAVIDLAGAAGAKLRGDAEEADRLLAKSAKHRADAAEHSARIARAFQGSPDPLFGGVTSGVSSTAKTAEEAAAEAAAKLEEAARKEAEARAAAAAAAAAGAKQRAEAERELADAIREAEASERAMTEAMMQAEQVRMEWLNRIDDLTARVEGPAAEAVLGFGRALADANAALATGVITMEEYQRYAQGLGQTLGNVAEEAKGLSDEMSVFAEKAAQNIQSFMGDAMYDLLDGNFKDIGKSFSNMIKRMLAEMAASKLLDMLSKFGAANSGTWWGSMLGGLSGKRAAGGPVRAGGTYLVGERGPELLRMGGNGGNITPNHMVPAMAAAGGMQVIVNNHGPQRVNAREENQQMPDGSVLRRMIIDVVAEDLGNGGTLARAGKSRFGWKETV
ncbi:hypothetical protein WCE55_00840 [Luteimonas sp. MJ293]|uniref:hypothetical protein n=1 Tax=Luteimonas sp. MJ146 TaxID=3129240 RepID=UPI0031BB8D32